MKKSILTIFLLIAYLIILIEILVFKNIALIRIGHLRFNFGGIQEGPANLIPFKTILYYLLGHNGLLIGGINIVGNIIALVPLGFLVPMVFSKINWNKIFLIALGSGLIIEGMQAVLHVGIFDIDDVLLNGLGVLIGFGKFNLFEKFSKKTKFILSTIVLGLIGLLFLLYTLSYFKLIHLSIGIESSVEKNVLPSIHTLNNRQIGNGQCCDPCNGTGGTGQIVSIGTNAITIIRRDGKNELIKLTKQTTIKTSSGPANNVVLKIGEHVTVIIDETETASAILVCGLK